MFVKHHLNFCSTSVTALALVIATPTALHAQETQESESAERETLEEVVVTASRRETDAFDLPQSIQSVTGETIRQLGLSNVENITALVPNLNLNYSTKRGGGFNIRGIAALSEQFSQFATVGVYVDETPISDGFANFDIALYDIERVEVLRGPQGTLYGEGSLGGTVRLITRKPQLDEFAAQIATSIEDTKDGDMSYRVDGMLNIPLAQDRAALRISASYNDLGGFLDTTVGPGETVNEDVNEVENAYVKAGLLVDASDKLDLTFDLIYQKRQHCCNENTDCY